MKNKINKFLAERLNFVVLKGFPRHSTRWAINHFKGKEITAIEIGTYEGFNAKNLLEELNIKNLKIIDPYTEYQDYRKSESKQTQRQLSKVEKRARKRLSEYSNRITWIKKYSYEAVDDIKEKVDFIYIDGNHEYEYILSDLRNYYPLLKKGGILAGHDITSFHGVAEALMKFCNEKKIKPFITRTDFIIIK